MQAKSLWSALNKTTTIKNIENIKNFNGKEKNLQKKI